MNGKPLDPNLIREMLKGKRDQALPDRQTEAWEGDDFEEGHHMTRRAHSP